MTDGSALLMNAVFGIMNTGHWSHERGTNLLDGGAHFYGTYATSDGKHISIGSIEPQFYALLLEKTGLDQDAPLPRQMSRENWPELRTRLESVFAQKTRDEWDAIMLGTDICYAPVLDFDDAIAHPHNRARETFVENSGVKQAAPAPRFSRTQPQLPETAVAPGSSTDAILLELGLDQGEIDTLRERGAVA
jgi:alpha-methylacyl-CoA racemase